MTCRGEAYMLRVNAYDLSCSYGRLFSASKYGASISGSRQIMATTCMYASTCEPLRQPYTKGVSRVDAAAGLSCQQTCYNKKSLSNSHEAAFGGGLCSTRPEERKCFQGPAERKCFQAPREVSLRCAGSSRGSRGTAGSLPRHPRHRLNG